MNKGRRQLVAIIFTEWDLDSTYKSFQAALKLQPGDAGIYHAYIIYITATNKLDEAIDTIKYALKLDPLSLPINHSLGETYLNTGMYGEVFEQLNKTLKLDPNFRATIGTKG